jgi:undecaprenyl-phosphate 4-deoxy-4-formamido-L-arabinose transferase
MTSNPEQGRPEISVVIPVHNEEGNLPELHRRLEAVLGAMRRPYEIVYVDDGSGDASLALLLGMRERSPGTVVVIELYRNYGQFRALTAGFERARGPIVVTLDADLQNPPEEIPRLVTCLEEGPYDVVNGWRANRQDTPFRRVASRIANRIAAALTGVKMRDYGCMLRAYRIEVVRQVVECREASPYIPTLANALARRATEIPVAHALRGSGQSNYSIWKLIHLQYDMITSFSVLPLRWLSLLGVAICGFAVLGGGAVLAAAALGAGGGLGVVPLLVVFLFLLIGILFLSLGFVGEYVGRIYNEVRHRPRYVVRTLHAPYATPAESEPRRSAESAAPIDHRDDRRPSKRDLTE